MRGEKRSRGRRLGELSDATAVGEEQWGRVPPATHQGRHGAPSPPPRPNPVGRATGEKRCPRVRVAPPPRKEGRQGREEPMVEG
jgi:hypothetical protein